MKLFIQMFFIFTMTIKYVIKSNFKKKVQLASYWIVEIKEVSS